MFFLVSVCADFWKRNYRSCCAVAMLQLIGCFSACSCTTLYSSIAKYEDMIDFRTSFNVLNRNYNTKESGCIQNYVKNSFGPFGMVGLEPLSGFQYNRTNLMGCFSPTLSNLRLRSNVSPAAISPVVNYRLNPSFFGGKGDKARYAEVTAASVGGAPAVSESGSGGRDMVDMAKGTWKSTVDAITYVGERAKEASNEVTPRVQQLLESQPYLRDVIVPVSGTLTGTVFAWVVLPGILKWLHMYLPHGSAALLSWPPSSGQVLYIKSFWGALDYPLRFLITFMAFSRMLVKLLYPSSFPCVL